MIVTYQTDEGDEIDCNVTPFLKGFSPFHLVYCTNLVQFDMSGCENYDTEATVDCLAFCPKIEKISFAGCFQFSENQLMKIFQQLKVLNDIDCWGSALFHHATAYFVVSSHRNLKRFIFERRFPVLEKKDWEKFRLECKDIILGHGLHKCICSK